MRSATISALIGLLVLGAAGAAEKKPWKDLYASVGDIKVHYIEAGAGTRAMVLVPGWTMIAEVWREQIPYFAARGFRVVAFDPRSHGLTTRTEGGNTYHQQAADLHALLKTLGIEHPVLVGWSNGVTVLLEYISSPETLQPEKVVLVDGSPRGLRGDDYPLGGTLDQARQTFLSLEEDRIKFTDKFVRSMFKGRMPEMVLKEILDGSLKTPTGAAVALFLDRLTGDRSPALPRIPSPTLVVVPDESRLLGEYLQSKIPRSKLEVIPESGHALFLEKPQTFNQTLETFLGEQ
jgi:pimeloyl-ACP methyl ester carboxylesterase